MTEHYPAPGPSINSVAQARVFISYSRRDAVAAEKLRNALSEQGFDAYLDTHEIAPGEAWQDRLHDLIASAEKVVFLISPDAVASDICSWEIDCAERLGKSLLPIVIRETPAANVPGRLQRLNFIFMRDDAERGDGFVALVDALRTDLAWEREKARITDDALAWDKAGRPNRLLLFAGEAIRAAEVWRDARPMDSPPLTELQIGFIDGSRRRRARVLRRVMIVSVVVTVITAISAVVAVWQRDVAQEATLVAQQRAAILSTGPAGDLAESGSTDAALVVLLEASQNFSAEHAPDALLIGFDRALQRASGEKRYALPATVEGFTVPGGLLLHDTATGAVSFFDGGGPPEKIGSLPGRILALAESWMAPGLLAALEDGGDLSVASIDYVNGEIKEVDQIVGFESGTDMDAQISPSGIVFFRSESYDAPGSILFDLNSGKSLLLEDLDSEYHEIATDSTGKNFLLPSNKETVSPILEITEDLELRPIAITEDLLVRLRFDRCLGTAVIDLRVQALRAAPLSSTVQAAVLGTGDYNSGILTCEVRGDVVMAHLSVMRNHVSYRESRLLKLGDKDVSLQYGKGTPKSPNIAAWWVEEDFDGDGDRYTVADPSFQEIRLYTDVAEGLSLGDPTTTFRESAEVEALTSHRAGELVVLRTAGVTASRSAPDLRLAVYKADQLLRYATIEHDAEPEDETGSFPYSRPLLSPKLCPEEFDDGVAEELETPTGFVRVVAVDETQGLPDQWIIEILDRERRVTSKTRVTSGMDVALEIDPIWDWENCVARLSKTGDFLLVKRNGEFLVLATSPDGVLANDPPPLRPGRVASAEFFAAGPSVITTDLSGKVTLWELSGTSGSSWTNRVIFSGSTELGYAQSDGKGSRLLLIE
ncbi:MAG: toll/interleukin-1 receptor domain-containing protein, partial [Rhodobacteraceae bacterium]|nr:toll/interleukin-1 receptor domain-containing protein [Paracoccaceae bacterium]